MDWWVIVLLAAAGVVLAVVVGPLVAWWLVSRRTKRLARRIGALSWRSKFALAKGLWSDQRIPPGVRLILPVLVLYLALPLDIIPDFIPVIGQVDDLLAIVVGVALLVRFIPPIVLDEHLSALEPAIEIGPPRLPELGAR